MIRRSFDLFGRTIDLLMPDASYLIEAEADFALRIAGGALAEMPPAPPARILILGAGAGLLPLALAGLWPGAEITAFEPHPALAAALATNLDAAGLTGRITAHAALPPVPEGAEPVRLIRSRDAPDFHDLKTLSALEGWMEVLSVPETDPGSGHGLIFCAAPALLPHALACAAADGAPLVARAEGLSDAPLPPIPLRIDFGPAGRLVRPGGAPAGALLDIIVPVHGVAEHVVECVESLLLDSPDGQRVTVVDDASPDDSVARLRAVFGPDRAEFRILSRPNGGCAAARNTGLAAATAPFIAFVDGDDAVEPGFFAALLTAAELTGLDIVQGGFRFLEDGETRESYEATDFADRPRAPEGGSPSFRLDARDLVTGQPAIWRRVYRRDFLAAHRLRFPEHVRAYDDQLFQLRSLMHTDEVLMLDGPCYLWRQHAGQDVKQRDERHFHSLGMFRAALAEALSTGWDGLGPLLTALVHTLNWSGALVREDLRPAYVTGAAELLAFFAKAAGPAGFDAARLAALRDADIAADYAALSARLAALPDGAAWAAFGSLAFDPGLVRLAGPASFL